MNFIWSVISKSQNTLMLPLNSFAMGIGTVAAVVSLCTHLMAGLPYRYIMGRFLQMLMKW
jgi:hypothetical protein